MKKLINEVADVVPHMLEGIAMAHPDVMLLQGWNVALRHDIDALKSRGEVALISGGGAGHEPAHAGYVGPGLLTAAVVGDVFTSPSTDAVLAAIRAVAGRGGVLLIVKNYTGDRLNFGLAAEIARAEGLAVEMVVVADDVALSAGGDHAGRRGLAGTVLVHKVAGAAAASGATLAEVKAAAQSALEAVGTLGVALGACTVPAAGRPGFELASNEIELGLGIHGEAGVRRIPIEPLDALMARLLDPIVEDLGLSAGDAVAMLVNNLGGTPTMEIALATRSALRRAATHGLVVERLWCGSFLTALEMPGVSVSLMRLDDARRAALDAPASAAAWPNKVHGHVLAAPTTRTPMPTKVDVVPLPVNVPAVSLALRSLCAALMAAEDELTRMDQQVGDGDLGISLARGARAILEAMSGYALNDPAATLRAMAATVRAAVGGTSGPLYAIALLRAATVFDANPAAPRVTQLALAWQQAALGIAEIGGAQVGDCTMLDALVPAAQALQDAAQAGDTVSGAYDLALTAASAGAASTVGLQARRGRASYLGERVIGHVDPGAQAVVLWMRALQPHLSGAVASP